MKEAPYFRRLPPLRRLLWMHKIVGGGGSSILKTVSGALIHITDALAKPLKKLVVNFEPVQSGTGDPSPDNVRPITGWTGANVYRSGADTSNPTTYPITFPSEAGTVYGGTLTINEDGSGKIVVDRGKVTPTNYNSALTRVDGYYARLVVPSYLVTDRSNYKANIAKIGSFGTLESLTELRIAPGGTVGASNTWMHCYIPDTLVDYDPEGSTTLLDCIKRDLPLGNWEIIVPRTEPITYTLTAQQVLTLLQGENNVWSDANGELELTYVAKAEETTP